MRAICSFSNALSSFPLCSHFLHELWSLSFLVLYSLSQSFMLRPCSDWKQHWQYKKLCQLGPFATGTDEKMRYPGMCQIVTVLYSNEAGFYIPRKLIHLWNFLHACNQNSKTFYRKAGILLVLEWLSSIVHKSKAEPGSMENLCNWMSALPIQFLTKARCQCEHIKDIICWKPTSLYKVWSEHVFIAGPNSHTQRHHDNYSHGDDDAYLHAVPLNNRPTWPSLTLIWPIKQI